MNSEDYYEILGVAPDASGAEIKRAFRKLALETHPDRNPGKRDAEERFKKISEAYGVLSDPEKRAQYDQYRRLGFGGPGTGSRAQSNFAYSQDEILRDFFGSGAFQDLFGEMQKEFQRMGFRFDEHFINNLFFGGNTYVFRGSFGGGPGRQRVRVFRYGDFGPAGGAKPEVSGKPPSLAKPLLKMSGLLLLQAGKKLGRMVKDKVLTLMQPAKKGASVRVSDPDVLYELEISPVDARNGTVIDVRLPHLEEHNAVSVKVPPGVHTGTKLRLRNMGRFAPDRRSRGDVYIQLQVRNR